MNKKKLSLLGSVLLAPVLLSTHVNNQAKADGKAATVATVNYVEGYGTVTWKNVTTNPEPTTHYLPTGSQWKINEVVTDSSGHRWYLVGNNEYANSQYYDTDIENAEQELKGTIKIDYVPGYGVNVWANPDYTKFSGNQLNHDSTHQVVARKLVNGQVWYQLDSKQWIDGKYGKLIQEESRKQKVDSSSSQQLTNEVKPSNPSKDENTTTSTNNTTTNNNQSNTASSNPSPTPHPSPTPTPQPNPEPQYDRDYTLNKMDGILEVGKDIPEGRYIAKGNTFDIQYNNSLNDDKKIDRATFAGNSDKFVSLKNGDIIHNKSNSVRLVSNDTIRSQTIESDKIEPGFYEIGKDISEGIYVISDDLDSDYTYNFTLIGIDDLPRIIENYTKENIPQFEMPFGMVDAAVKNRNIDSLSQKQVYLKKGDRIALSNYAYSKYHFKLITKNAEFIKNVKYVTSTPQYVGEDKDLKPGRYAVQPGISELNVYRYENENDTKIKNISLFNSDNKFITLEEGDIVKTTFGNTIINTSDEIEQSKPQDILDSGYMNVGTKSTDQLKPGKYKFYVDRGYAYLSINVNPDNVKHGSGTFIKLDAGINKGGQETSDNKNSQILDLQDNTLLENKYGYLIHFEKLDDQQENSNSSNYSEN